MSEFDVEIRTNKGNRIWRDTHELSLVTCVSETSDDRWFEATIMEVSARRSRQTELTKPDQAVSRLTGPLSIRVRYHKIMWMLPLKKKVTARNHTCGDLADLITSIQLNPSLSSSSDTDPACFSVEMMYARSFSVKKRAFSGERGRRKKEITPKRKVNMPSCQDR